MEEKGKTDNSLLSLCSLFLFPGLCHKEVEPFVLLYTFTVLNELQFKDEINRTKNNIHCVKLTSYFLYFIFFFEVYSFLVDFCIPN